MAISEAQPHVFISYARSDDELFVERLHHDLEAADIDVWWDRDTIASRGRTFLQEIRDAIEAVDRVIAVIGPGATRSNYVRYEWEHALLFAKGLLPILRLGDYGLVPSELLPENDQGLAASDFGRLHCPDFRAERPYDKALSELVAIIRQPVPPLASYDGTPALPPHFLPRRDDLRRLKETVLADVLRPTVITPAKQIMALQGMGGIGKSVLAAAFARAINTRRAMRDGIVWLSAGRDATRLTLLANIKAVGTAFGDAEAHYFDEVSARRHLPEVLENKTCLIILDDVWSMEQVEPFRDAIGPRCRLLITTRDGSLVTVLEAQEHGIDFLSDEQALALLADWSGQAREAFPEETRQVAKECGNLPFALALCGAMARDGAPWPDLLDALQEADLTFIEARLPGYEFPNVLRALHVSVDMLGRENPVAVSRYHDLAVFPSDAAVPEAAVVTLWCRERGFSERNARKLLTTLGRKALLTLQGNSPHRRVSFHDLQHDYLRAVAGGDIATLHGTFIDAYRSKYPDDWANGPNDGYFFQFLPYHLAAAGRRDELTALLADYAWIEAKLKAMDVRSVISDHDLVANEPDLSLVQGALRLSIPALSRDWTHLPSQLIGRLRSFEEPRIQALLERASAGPGKLWLCPQTVSLTPPRPFLQTFARHTAPVCALAALSDGRALSGSWDGTLRLWDLASGESRVLQSDTYTVTALAALSDGRVLSGSWDGTLRLWEDFESDKSRVLKGSPGWGWGGVRALAVLPGGRVLSGLGDGTLQLWDLASGLCCVLTGHTSRVSTLAALSDGRVISGSYDGTLRLWDLASGKSRVLAGHTSPVSALVAFPDGRALSGLVAVAFPDGCALSGSWDGTLRLWDLASGQSWELKDHTGPVHGLAVLADGPILSGSRDMSVIVWDLSRNAPIATFIGDGLITRVATTPTHILAAASAPVKPPHHPASPASANAPANIVIHCLRLCQ